MAVSERQQLNPEQRRSLGWDLATKVRFLREEVREGRDPVRNLKELEDKTSKLVGLFPIPDDCGIITFEVRDTTEAHNTSGFVFGRRKIEVINPNAQKHVLKKFDISLLMVGQARENLEDLGVSEILPPAYGGI